MFTESKAVNEETVKIRQQFKLDSIYTFCQYTNPPKTNRFLFLCSMHLVNNCTVSIELLLEKIIFYFRKFATTPACNDFVTIASYLKFTINDHKTSYQVESQHNRQHFKTQKRSQHDFIKLQTVHLSNLLHNCCQCTPSCLHVTTEINTTSTVRLKH